MNISDYNDSEVLSLIGNRIRLERLNQNITQENIALNAGVGLIVMKRLESGEGCTLSSLIRILRTLGKLDQLDLFIPEPGISPLQLSKLSGKQRQKATGRHKS